MCLASVSEPLDKMLHDKTKAKKTDDKVTLKVCLVQGSNSSNLICYCEDSRGLSKIVEFTAAIFPASLNAKFSSR